MRIKPPLTITSRLKPGVKIGVGTISIEYACSSSGRPGKIIHPNSRQVYRWFIDLPLPQARWGVRSDNNGEFQGDDLVSGVGGGTLQEGLESLLGFLGAFADCDPDSGESKLFPAGLTDWAVANADEFAVLEFELQEHPGEFIVE